MQDERDRVGRFFLKRYNSAKYWYICWYDPKTRQTAGVSTGTADRDAARQALLDHALRHERPTVGADAQLAEVLQAYYIHYAQHLPSAPAQRAAQRDALDLWGDANVSALTRNKQLELVTALRERGLSDWTIDGRLNRIWAAMSWCKRDNKDLVIPEQITAEDWKPVLVDRDRTFSLEELAALFNAAAARPENERYTREHWWRFLVLAVGTASREAALRELTWDRVDLRLGRIQLNPEGRRQTKKRRPTIVIAPTLAAELAAWREEDVAAGAATHAKVPPRPPGAAGTLGTRGEAHVITYYGKPLATREFFDLLAEKAGVSGGPNVIRHTVRTWLAEDGVPDSEADVFMGHREEGSPTGRRYKHRRPEYLRNVADSIEGLYEAVAGLLTRSFKSHVTVDQPAPDDPHVRAAAAMARRRGETRVCNFFDPVAAEDSGAGGE
jgi:integrase